MGQEPEAIIQGGAYLLGRQHAHAGRGQLNRERQAVESATDLVHRCQRVVPQDDATCRGKLDEERGRVLDRQRPERKDVLGRKP